MNEDLQKALAEFVKASLLTFQQGKDFVVAQAPDVIQQLIRWHFWEAILWIVIDALLIFVCWRVTKRLLATDQLKDGFDPGPAAFGVIGCYVIGGITAVNIFFWQVPTLIQIYVAPKVWLLEWAMRQVKGS